MNYFSTRDTERKNPKTSAEVIKQGLADDGGLFLPEQIPQIDLDFISGMSKLTYSERAAKILSLYLSDYTYDELLDCAKGAYESGFDGYAAPVSMLVGENLRVLELWHGPTCAFKDMALQIMPRLLSLALKKTGEKRDALILVATSGDTGKAALEGYKDVDGVKITVFYPEDGVSKMQKLQMTTQEGSNVRVCAIKGNFDDAQSGVKQIFASEKIREELNAKNCFLSSANSINWGRLAPQIVYYISAYADLVEQGDIKLGDKVDVTVPTGNFGNIFAAILAKRMGLPIGKFVCASNSNNILTDFLNTGVYDRNRQFYTTISPSMDILISSNLERLLYFAAGAQKTREYMKSLAQTGRYEVDKDILDMLKEDFDAYCCDEDNCRKTIGGVFEKYSYLSDPHTAVALYAAYRFTNEKKTGRKNIVASTASPYKFAADVLDALGQTVPSDMFEVLTKLSDVSRTPIPEPLAALSGKAVRFTETVEKNVDALASVL